MMVSLFLSVDAPAHYWSFVLYCEDEYVLLLCYVACVYCMCLMTHGFSRSKIGNVSKQQDDKEDEE